MCSTDEMIHNALGPLVAHVEKKRVNGASGYTLFAKKPIFRERNIILFVKLQPVSPQYVQGTKSRLLYQNQKEDSIE